MFKKYDFAKDSIRYKNSWDSWQNFKDILPSNGLLDSVYPDGAIAWIGESLNTTFQLSISSLGKFNLIIFWMDKT